MKDNYEKDEKISPCEDCIYKNNPRMCQTCKHHKNQLIRHILKVNQRPSLFERLGFNSTIE